MIAYKFSVRNDGTLVCYKYDKTLTKYTSEYALEKINHVKDFSFYAFEKTTINNSSKKEHNLAFVSRNHIVTYDNIEKFQKHAKKTNLKIEEELKELIKITKENELNNQREKLYLERKRKERLELLKANLLNTKKYLASIQAATTMSLTALLAMSATTDLNSSNTIENVKKERSILTFNDMKESLIEKETDYSIIIPDKNIALANAYIEEKAKEEAKEKEQEVQISDEELLMIKDFEEYDGLILDSYNGVVTKGPSGGLESYYDADAISEYGMNGVIKIMRDLGYSEEQYPYYIREDGVRMLGRYVMVAANLETYPRGSLVETSLGIGMICDACESANENIYQLDIAVNWTKKLWK